MLFSYIATVRPSPAYDTTTVTAPDPVFRRVAKSVTAHLTYHGAPGTMTVAVRLSTPDGWQTLVPLTAPERFTATDHEVKVPLDLAAFETRTAAAPAPAGGHGPRTLGMLGRHASVAAVQIGAGILLVVGMFLAGLVLLLARLAGPSGEAVGIRRRYALQLAHVEPITPPVGLPLIDVPEFATLAMIAEKAGLLILHWVQAGVETFVILDETTTHRFRIPGVAATTDPDDGQTRPAPAPASGDPAPD